MDIKVADSIRALIIINLQVHSALLMYSSALQRCDVLLGMFASIFICRAFIGYSGERFELLLIDAKATCLTSLYCRHTAVEEMCGA